MNDIDIPCYYCHKAIKTINFFSDGINTFICEQHPLNVQHIYYAGTLQYISIEKKIDRTIYECFISINNDGKLLAPGYAEFGKYIPEYNILCQLPVPKNLNPETFSAFLDRIINLGVFL